MGPIGPMDVTDDSHTRGVPRAPAGLADAGAVPGSSALSELAFARRSDVGATPSARSGPCLGSTWSDACWSRTERRPVAYGPCWVETPPGRARRRPDRRPGRSRPGFERYLLGLCEAWPPRSSRRRAPKRQPFRVSDETDGPRIALNERRGFAHVSTFLRSTASSTTSSTLRSGPPASAWPRSGRALTTWLVFAAHEGWFADHPGAGRDRSRGAARVALRPGGPDLPRRLVAWDDAAVVGGIEAGRRLPARTWGSCRAQALAGPWHRQGADARRECAKLRRRGMRRASLCRGRGQRDGSRRQPHGISRLLPQALAARCSSRSRSDPRETPLAGNGAHADCPAGTTIGHGPAQAGGR